ncbi:MAG: hypothetical protein JW920_05845, partial [Deltaproteobacteria bacterium]|nr:hypothetical protein [Deltaproteobacteria bacterium]
MKRYQIIFLMFFFVFWLGACNSSSSHSSSANSENTVANNEQPSQDNQGQLPDPTVDPFSANGLTIIDQVCVDEDTGYLAEDVNGKQYLILQGSPASIGFQVGFLMPEGTYKMTKEYAFMVLEAMLGVSYEESPRIYEFLKGEILTLCNYAIEKNAIPGYLLEEMQGVAAGALMRGYDVAFEDVLILNLGYDALYSILFTGTLPSMSGLQRLLGELPGIQEYVRIEDAKVFFPNAGELMGCNEFVISGSSAEEDKVFHGRDFMFVTGGIYENYACMSVYLPDDGYPFVASSCPGFVGQTTSLNSQGLSMGMDVVYGACTRSDPGLGCLMVLRDIVQNCSNLDEAVERMKNKQDRGVSWLYILA